jgi:hypothetical protein
MIKFNFCVTIDTRTELGQKDYVRGRIAGIISATINAYDRNDEFEAFNNPFIKTDNKVYVIFECSLKAMCEIKKQLEQIYPEVCKYYVILR